MGPSAKTDRCSFMRNDPLFDHPWKLPSEISGSVLRGPGEKKKICFPICRKMGKTNSGLQSQINSEGPQFNG